MLKVAIIEDEVSATQHLQKLLASSQGEIEVVTHLNSVKASVEWLNKHPLPDLLFMDIRLSDGLSFTILEQCFVDCPIIFTTAYDEYALQAFKTNGIDYLLKPITASELAQALGKLYLLREQATDWQRQHLNISQQVQNQTPTTYRERFLFKKGKELIPLRVEDIAYFYRSDLVFAVTNAGEQYLAEFSLTELQRQLSPKRYIRLNRSYLVNIDAIRSLRPTKPGQLAVQLDPPVNEPIELSAKRSRYVRTVLQDQ